MVRVERLKASKKTVKMLKMTSVTGYLKTKRSGDVGLFKAAVKIGIIKASQPRTVKKRERVVRSL
jgi:hypothetical protein